MLFLAVLIFEIILVYFFSMLFIRAFANLIYHFSGSQKLLIILYTVLFLPGTIIHELAHFFMAAILMVPVGHIHILPEVVEGGIHMGTVSTAETDVFRRTLIGIAPFLVGTGIIIVSIIYLPSLILLWQKILVVYFIFEISNTMFASPEDLKESWGLFVAIFLLGLIFSFALYYFKIAIKIDGLAPYLEGTIRILLIPLGINFIAFLFTQILCLAPHPAFGRRGAQHT